MKYIKRDRSVLTRKKNLEELKVYKKFPVYIGCTDQPQEKDILVDMSVAICKDTGIIQLDKVLPLDVVYAEYHSEALGNVWKNHHLSFLEFLGKYHPTKILEIGGSNGFMALEYLKKYPKTRWVMVEPTPSVKSKKNLKIIAKNFDSKFRLDESVNAIVHSHVFEHIYEPVEYLASISKFLSEGGFHIFSVPNLYQYLNLKYANWMNFEHTIFLTEHIIDELLRNYNFEVIEKKYYQNHSIFYATRKVKGALRPKSRMIHKNRYKDYKEMFNNFLSYYKKTINNLNLRIKHHNGEVYLFGAHIFSQYLIHQGLKGNIVKILDNSTLKEKKRLYGTSLYIEKPEYIKDKNNVAVILRAGEYQAEVKAQLLSLNENVIIWED